jgi:D-3-phosphoglycerate dehydrogenase / 2-oxoglutarate reductase
MSGTAMIKILVSDKLAQEGLDVLNAVKEFQVDCQYGLSPEALKEIIKDYDALIIRSGTTVTADIIKAADRLKAIGRAGVGLDNVDLAAATQKGIVAMNTPGGNTTATAEHTMSLIMALSRNIPQAHASMKAGKWDRVKFSGVELHGKILGVIGLGRIGSTVAKFAKAFGMKVIAFDPFLSMDSVAQREVEPVLLEDLYKRADFITVHVPKTADTKNLIGDKEIALMKPTVRLINCARGGIIDESALAKALEVGRISGCALDVYEKEPLDPSSPLLKFDNCVLTPHLGASTSEAQVNVAVEVAETIRDALLGHGIANAANFPSVDAETYKSLEPYNRLAFRMGKFAGQLINGAVSSVTLTYSGTINQFKVAPVTFSAINGLLKPVLGEAVNFINALTVANERLISVQEVKSSKQEEFVNCLTMEIKTDKTVFSLTGTLSAKGDPRIVKVNDVYLEISPEGYLIYVTNNDKPGLVGAMGMILANAGINIGGISLSRESQDGVAVSVVQIDSQAGVEVLESIKKTRDVLFVKQIFV